MREDIHPLTSSQRRGTRSDPSTALDLVLAEAQPETLPEVTLPVEVAPFNDMARYFGAAGTVMAGLQQNWVYYTTEAQIRESCWRWFRTHGRDFVDKVAEIVVGYYHAHPCNRAAWDAAVQEKQRMLDAGRSTIQEHRPGFEQLAEADRPEALRLLRTIWP